MLKLLKEHIRMLLELDSIMHTIQNAPMAKLSVRKAGDRMAEADAELSRYRRLKVSAYEDLQDGLLSKEDYLDIKAQYEERIVSLETAKEQIRRELDLYLKNGDSQQQWIQEFLEHRNIQRLSRSVAVECIDRIQIYEDKRIEVTFTHMQDYQSLVSKVNDYYLEQKGAS